MCDICGVEGVRLWQREGGGVGVPIVCIDHLYEYDRFQKSKSWLMRNCAIARGCNDNSLYFPVYVRNGDIWSIGYSDNEGREIIKLWLQQPTTV